MLRHVNQPFHTWISLKTKKKAVTNKNRPGRSQEDWDRIKEMMIRSIKKQESEQELNAEKG